jgi:hypothetical protein
MAIEPSRVSGLPLRSRWFAAVAASFSVRGSDIFSHVDSGVEKVEIPGSEVLIARNRASGGAQSFSPVGASNSGLPPQIATADWLEELSVYGTARNLRDEELAYQLSLAIENVYLVRLALRRSDKRRSEAHCG